MRIHLTQILLELGFINAEQLNTAERALATGEFTGRIGEILTKLGYATEDQIAQALAVKDKYTYVQEPAGYLTPEVQSILTEAECRRLQVVPLFIKESVLYLAMLNPYDLAIQDAVGAKGGGVKTPYMAVEPVFSTRAKIYDAITKLFGEAVEDKPAPSPAAQSQIDAAVQDAVKAVSRAGAEKEPDDAPIIRLVNKIVTDALEKRASDIHVEPQQDAVYIRYRIDGMLHDVMNLPQAITKALLSRIKIMARLDIAEARKPQDGRIQTRTGDRMVDIRVSTLPVVGGEKAVLRILDTGDRLFSLDNLGIQESTTRQLRHILRSPNGLLLVTGPTGSGKTTMLYACLYDILDLTKNVSTLEDPVEYQIPRINQVAVNPKADLTFATGLRAILRQDPDIIMVGEIRDIETAQIAVQAAMTGHLVLSTLHTNDACGAVARLQDMQVDPFLLGSALRGVVAQRLVRKLCIRCRKQARPMDAVLKTLRFTDLPADPQFWQPIGCEACAGTGYRGRVAVFEFLQVTKKIQEMIISKATEKEIQAEARLGGFQSMYETGLYRLLDGDTSLEEFHRVLRWEE